VESPANRNQAQHTMSPVNVLGLAGILGQLSIDNVDTASTALGATGTHKEYHLDGEHGDDGDIDLNDDDNDDATSISSMQVHVGGDDIDLVGLSGSRTDEEQQDQMQLTLGSTTDTAGAANTASTASTSRGPPDWAEWNSIMVRRRQRLGPIRAMLRSSRVQAAGRHPDMVRNVQFLAIRGTTLGRVRVQKIDGTGHGYWQEEQRCAIYRRKRNSPSPQPQTDQGGFGRGQNCRQSADAWRGWRTGSPSCRQLGSLTPTELVHHPTHQTSPSNLASPVVSHTQVGSENPLLSAGDFSPFVLRQVGKKSG